MLLDGQVQRGQEISVGAGDGRLSFEASG